MPRDLKKKEKVAASSPNGIAPHPNILTNFSESQQIHFQRKTEIIALTSESILQKTEVIFWPQF